MLNIQFSKAKKLGSISVKSLGPRRPIPGEARLGTELRQYVPTDSNFIFNGLESFAADRLPAAVVLAALRAIPEVYAGTFTMLDPAYGVDPGITGYNLAVAVAVEAAEDFGTEIPEYAKTVRASLITTQEELKAFAAQLEVEPVLAIDIETFPLVTPFLNRDIGDTRKSEVRLLSVSTEHYNRVIDVQACGHNLQPLKPLLETKAIVGHNLAFEFAFLLDRYGIELKGELFDTLIAARILSNEAPLMIPPWDLQLMLDRWSDELVNSPGLYDDDEDDDDNDDFDGPTNKKHRRFNFIGDAERIGCGLDKVRARFLGLEGGIWDLDMAASNWALGYLSDRQLAYSMLDTSCLLELKAALLAAADEGDLRIIQLDQAALVVCLAFYKEGMPVNRAGLKRQIQLRREVYQDAYIAAKAVWPNVDFQSAKSIVRALGERDIYVECADKYALLAVKHLPGVSELIKIRGLIAELRDLEKRFLANLRDDDRLRSFYNPVGAGTGRLTSKSPNLQNVPRPPKKDARALDPGITNSRELFEAPPGYQMVVADYNQMELRGIAVVTQDPRMLAVYSRPKGCLHTETASAFFREPPFETTTPARQEELRDMAKPINFGFCYGSGVRGFLSFAAKSYELHLSYEEGEAFRQKFFDWFDGVDVWIVDAKREAKGYPEYGTTLLGRKRWLHPRAEDCDGWWAAFQFLTNFVIQGSCADVLKLALVAIHKALDPAQAQLVSSVHDEILVLAKDEYVETAEKIVRQCMEHAAAQVFGDAVRFTVKVKSGQTWACK